MFKWLKKFFNQYTLTDEVSKPVFYTTEMCKQFLKTVVGKDLNINATIIYRDLSGNSIEVKYTDYLDCEVRFEETNFAIFYAKTGNNRRRFSTFYDYFSEIGKIYTTKERFTSYCVATEVLRSSDKNVLLGSLHDYIERVKDQRLIKDNIAYTFDRAINVEVLETERSIDLHNIVAVSKEST
jgi:hypothetical protein